MKEEEVEPIWSPRWTWQNVAERRCEHSKVEVKLHLGCRPLSRQKWPSWGGANGWSQSISDNVVLQQLVHYLLVRFLNQLCVLRSSFFSLFCKNSYKNIKGSMLIREEDFCVVTCLMDFRLWQIAYFFSKHYILISFWASQELYRRKQR